MTTAGERQADVARLRSALSDLAGEDAPGTPTFAAPRARGVNEPECRSTRASMHDYLSARLLPTRRRRLETHMDGCAECTRAFIDVREASWRLRDLDQRLVTADHRGGRHRRTLRRHVAATTG